jgi:hypothetical protein
MKRLIVCCFAMVAILVTLSTTFSTEVKAQNSVEGTLTVNEETFQLKYIYIFQQEDEVAVFLTDAQVSPDKIPYDIIDLANEGGIHGFSVGISKSEKRISEYSYFNAIYHKAMMGRGQLSNFGTLEIKIFDADVLDAGLALDKPGIVFCADCPKDHTYLYDVTFKVNLAVGKGKSMKPVEIIVSGDDTPAGKAYASYYKAKLAGDIDEVRKWVVKEHVKDFDSEMGKAMIKMSMSIDPKEVEIVKTDISGDSAKLTVKGTTNDQTLATGSVEMVLENGQWKVDIDKWDFTK